MDDEIEIEEHDILEHPQVKAVFPDLNKILIQVHTAGDTFLDDAQEIQDSEENEEEDNLEAVSHLIVRNFEQGSDISDPEVALDDPEPVSTDNEDPEPAQTDNEEPVHVITDSEGDTQSMSNDNAIDNISSHDKQETDELDEVLLAADELIDVHLPVNTQNDECVTNGHGEDEEQRLNEENSENGDELVEVYLQLNEHQEVNDDFVDPENESDPKNGEIENEYEENEDDEDFQPIRIKEEIVFESDMSDYEEILPDRFSDGQPDETVHYNNKIILGSKPSPQNDCNLKFLMVVLEDWRVHLSESQSYCSDCKTLFTTPNALDFHRMSAHSLLAPITNRALKSTTKAPMYTKNVCKKSTAKEISNSTYCNHCNVSFKDHTSLIKHLYELLPANKYPCKVCNAVFSSQTDLINHNAIHIKIEPRNILKPKKNTGNSLLRKILSSEMKPITISKATKRQYPVDEKASKNVKRNHVEVKSEPIEYKWKCVVCKDMFDSYGQARRHRTRHPNAAAYRLMVKRIPIKPTKVNSAKLTFEKEKSIKAKPFIPIKPTKVNSKAKLTFEKEKSIKAKPFELIQTSALFQCMKCGLHFSSSSAANSHFTAKTCGNSPNWSCPICKKNMRCYEKKYHEKQHELGSKIKIYKITKNTYERTLCRCLKCNLYFEYILLKYHIGKCGKITSAKCKECNINIPNYKHLEHTQKHNLRKLKRKDFILIDYAVLNDKRKAVQSKTPKDFKFLGKQVKTIKAEPSHKPKILNQLTYEKEKRKLAYCDYCKCFFNRTYKSTNNHITKKCAKRKDSISVCKFCGLRVFSKLLHAHLKLHTVNKLTLNDFEFYDYVSRKPIVPPIPQFPSCDKCQIHFLNNIMNSNHICGEDYENCEICGEKFENKALEIHLPLHQLATNNMKPSRAILPELIMKYESLNAIWNILFECSRCDLVTDLYDSAVEHSQAHIAKSHSNTNTIKCYICNLKFDENCWGKHSELHSRMPINSKHFRILKFFPKELLEESWFRMFASLPEKETRQILDKSLFGTERSLKMVLVKNGLPEFTVYCCSECRVCCDSNAILDHASLDCERYDIICTECDLAFDTKLSLNNHQQLHDNGIKNDEFRIVRFVKPLTKKANQKDVKHKKYVLYKCVECTICLFMAYNRDYHVCARKNFIVYCKICQQNFTIKQNTKHRARHINQKDFRAKNIRVEDFVPIPEGPDKPSREKPSKLKKNKGKAKQRKINQNPVVPERGHSDKLELENPEPTTSHKRSSSVECFESLVNIITDNKTRKSNRLSGGDIERTAKLYKCECGLHYTSLRSAQKHVDSCDDNEEISKENCSKCGLLFPTDLLVAHLCRHHSRATKLCVEELRKSETDTNETEEIPTTNTESPKRTGIKLYKCGECNVYFINQKSVYQHVLKHKPLDSKQFIECKLCRLQFRIVSLHIHMKKHHEEEFSLDKVLVEEYQPTVGNKTPKIDIYFANDRFESVQVSSSND